MTTTYKSKKGLIIPKSISRAAHWKNGEEIEFKRLGRQIMASPKAADPDDVLTQKEAALVKKAEREIRQGKYITLDQLLHELDRPNSGRRRKAA